CVPFDPVLIINNMNVSPGPCNIGLYRLPGAYGERNMSQKTLQWNRCLPGFFLCALASLPQALADEPAKKAETDHKPPVQLTAREDHQRMMELLKIKSLRPGANPNDPKSSNA